MKQSPFVLFVCTGNICRSPMAAAFLRAHAEKDGDTIRVESAGTWGVDGQDAAPLARQVMQARGMALEGHVARTVSPELMRDADLIIVMTRSHRDALRAEFPDARSKIRLTSELIGLEYDIADPYGGPREAFEMCAKDLERLIERGYPRIKEWLDHTPERLSNA